MDKPVLARLQHLMTLREEVELLGRGGPWQPAADWQDAGTHLVLLLDVPNVDAESLSLSEEGNTLTVTGERVAPRRLLYSERPAGAFERTLTFPEEVVPQSGQANLSGGVLTVTFEKKHPTIDIAADDLSEDES